MHSSTRCTRSSTVLTSVRVAPQLRSLSFAWWVSLEWSAEHECSPSHIATCGRMFAKCARQRRFQELIEIEPQRTKQFDINTTSGSDDEEPTCPYCHEPGVANLSFGSLTRCMICVSCRTWVCKLCLGLTIGADTESRDRQGRSTFPVWPRTCSKTRPTMCRDPSFTARPWLIGSRLTLLVLVSTSIVSWLSEHTFKDASQSQWKTEQSLPKLGLLSCFSSWHRRTTDDLIATRMGPRRPP